MRVLLSVSLLISIASGADFTTVISSTNANQYLTIAAIAADSAGETYVAGTRTFRTPATPTDVFVTKLDATGNVVSTKTFGGQCCSFTFAIATDPVGNIWVGGNSYSPDFPLVRPLQSHVGTISWTRERFPGENIAQREHPVFLLLRRPPWGHNNIWHRVRSERKRLRYRYD
jgi:hypothetical protein